MSVYTKSKTTVSNLKTKELESTKDTFKVGVAEGAEDLVIDYITNLYSNPATAVVRELFTNACDASPIENPIKITIDRVEDENYSFEIIDTGCGMSKEELKQHYITYASSNKVDDFDQVGSFGLGAKSPMALVPSYTVTSNNGKEENTYVVSRTKKGIYAALTSNDKINNQSFTRVKFDGLSYKVAEAMHKFIVNMVTPYSRHELVIDSWFGEQRNYLEDTMDLDLFDGFKTTLYSRNIEKHIWNVVSNRVTKNSWYVRLNDIIYPLFRHDDAVAPFKVIIEVDPGYFAFAPNRESLPVGEKLTHLQDKVENMKLSMDRTIQFLLDSDLFTKDEITDKYQRESFKSFRDDGCGNFCESAAKKLGKENYKLIKASWALYQTQYDIEKNFPNYSSDDVEIIRYKRVGERVLFERKSIGMLELASDMRNNISFMSGCYKNMLLGTQDPHYDYMNGASTCKIVEGTRFNKKNKAIIRDPKYKTRDVSSEYWKEAYSQYGCTSWSGKVNVYFVFVKDGYTLPSALKHMLNYLNTHKNDNDIVFYNTPVETANYDVTPRSSVPRQVTKVDDRRVTFTHLFGYSEKIIKLGDMDHSKKFLFSYNRNYFASDLGRAITLIEGKNIYVIDDRTKMVRDYLESNGHKYISLDGINEQTMGIRNHCGNTIKNAALNKIVHKHDLYKFIETYRTSKSNVRTEFDAVNYMNFLQEKNDEKQFVGNLYCTLNASGIGGQNLAEFIKIPDGIEKWDNEDAKSLFYPKYNFFEKVFGNDMDDTEKVKFTEHILTKYFDYDRYVNENYEQLLCNYLYDTTIRKNMSYIRVHDIDVKDHKAYALRGSNFERVFSRLLDEHFQNRYKKSKNCVKLCLERLEEPEKNYPALKYRLIKFSDNELDNEVKKQFLADKNRYVKDWAMVFPKKTVEVE